MILLVSIRFDSIKYYFYNFTKLVHICTVRRLDLVHVYIGTNSNHCYEIVSTIKYQPVFVVLFQGYYLYIS